MPQLSLYLDDVAMDDLRCRAAQEGLSLSRFARNQICAPSTSKWPDTFWRTYGALNDETFRLPDELDFSADAPRGSFDD